MNQFWSCLGPLETVLFAIMVISALGAILLTLTVHVSVRKNNAKKRNKNAQRRHQHDGLIVSH